MNAADFALRTLGCAMIAGTLAAQTPANPEFDALRAMFDAKVKLEVQQPYDAGVVDLNVKYTAALDRALETAQQAGKLEDALAVKNEKESVATGKGVPAADDEKVPPLLKQLRGTYRESIARLEAERKQRLQPHQAAFGASLDALVTNLTRQGKLQEALAVKKEREALAADSPAPPPAMLGRAPLAGAFSGVTIKSPFVNNLGMKFVPVPDTKVLFCIHETRYKDYAAYAAEVPSVDGSWKDQSAEGVVPTEKKEEHPVTQVTWDEARSFCAWLSAKEGKTYRLPTDREWSIAVGLGEREQWTEGATPETLNGAVLDSFPWEGTKSPPPKGAGNYSDRSRKSKAAFPSTSKFVDHDDGYPTTAPVMSFKPNKLGLYDLGGNVWEWCEDWFEVGSKRLLRGASWTAAGKEWEISSRRLPRTPDFRASSYGFRVVLEVK